MSTFEMENPNLMRRDHLIMAALYDRAKDIDSRSNTIMIIPEGAESNQTTIEYLKLVSCWKEYGGKERWDVFQRARKAVEARMVWVSDERLDNRKLLQTGNSLMLVAEDEFMKATLLVQSILDGSAPAYLTVASAAETSTSFYQRLHNEQTLGEKLIFSELYSIGRKYEGLQNDSRAAFWRSISGDIRNKIYVSCASQLENFWDPQSRTQRGVVVQEANDQSVWITYHASDIFGTTIDEYDLENN